MALPIFSDELREILEYAPATAPVQAGLLGWTSPRGFVCAVCAGRAMARGFGAMFRGFSAVWDGPLPGPCAGCFVPPDAYPDPEARLMAGGDYP